MSKDDRVREILERYGEDMSATWTVQGQRVIYHAALERIAVKAGIRWLDPVFLIALPDHVVVQASGKISYGTNTNPDIGERYEWSVGEAHVGVNYRVSGKQAAYPFAMAEKRAKDRVILKLIALHGLVYSEDEADDFKEAAPERKGPVITSGFQLQEAAEAERGPDRRSVMQQAVSTNQTAELEDGQVTPMSAWRRRINEKASINSLTDFMLDPQTQSYLAALSPEEREDVRDYAKQRLVALGWGKSGGV